MLTGNMNTTKPSFFLLLSIATSGETGNKTEYRNRFPARKTVQNFKKSIDLFWKPETHLAFNAQNVPGLIEHGRLTLQKYEVQGKG